MPAQDADLPAPACSVLLPTYNRAAFLPEAFDAIRAQRFADWELIVVDDGSTDDTPAVIEREIARTRQLVRVVSQPNAGVYAARNTALGLARGRFIAFYDSDDRWLPHHLSRCVAALDTHAELDWVYGACRMVDHATGRELNASTFRMGGKPNAFLSLHTRREGDLRVIDDPRVTRLAIRHGLYCGLQNSVIRRRLFNGRRFAAAARNESEDQVFHVIAVASGHVLGYFDDVHVEYRVHADNSSSAGTGLTPRRHRTLLRRHLGGYDDLPDRAALSPSQRRDLRRRMANERFWKLGYALWWRSGQRRRALVAMRCAVRLDPGNLWLQSLYRLYRCRHALTGSRAETQQAAGPRPSGYLCRRLELAILSAYLRHSPLDAGRWRGYGRAKHLAAELAPWLGPTTLRTRGGFKMRVDRAEWLGRHVYATGEWEPPTSLLARRLLRPGDTVLDIGANVGYFSLLAADAVGPAGRVFAFEPIPTTRASLEHNVALNHAGHIEVRDTAVSDETRPTTIYAGPPEHSGIASLRDFAGAGHAVDIQCTRLDDTLDRWPRIALIKLDVEGAEHLALRGMAGLLARDLPDLVIEVTHDALVEMGSGAPAMFAMLSDLGYRGYRIDGDTTDAWLSQLAPGEESQGQFNALFTTRRELPVSIHRQPAKAAA